MKWNFDNPLSVGSRKTVRITSVKHGVTEVGLSDGRTVRLSIHIEGLKPDASQVDIAYAVVSEVVLPSDSLVLEPHEGVQ